jgi:hypothetical protein
MQSTAPRVVDRLRHWRKENEKSVAWLALTLDYYSEDSIYKLSRYEVIPCKKRREKIGELVGLTEEEVRRDFESNYRPTNRLRIKKTSEGKVAASPSLMVMPSPVQEKSDDERS